MIGCENDGVLWIIVPTNGGSRAPRTLEASGKQPTFTYVVRCSPEMQRHPGLVFTIFLITL